MNFLYSLIFTMARAASTTVSSTGGAVSPASSGSPIETVSGLYSFALMIAAGLAIGVLVYGGLKYVWSSANPNSKTDAREWITGALWGLLILAGLWIILNLINPDLTVLQLPTLTPLQVQSPLPTGTDYAVQTYLQGFSGQETTYRTFLHNIGVTFNANPPQTQVGGLQLKTVAEVSALKTACNCPLEITGGSEPGGPNGTHTTGDTSHTTGYKVDIAPNAALDSFVKAKYTPIQTRSDGAQQWKAPDGAIYAYEAGAHPHWDILVSP